MVKKYCWMCDGRLKGWTISPDGGPICAACRDWAYVTTEVK